VSGVAVDPGTWKRAERFRLFRDYERPHFAVTARVDATDLMAVRAATGLSPFRACLHAVGAGLHAVPELGMRLRGDGVVRHERLRLSPAVAVGDGDFRYCYLDWRTDFAVFDAEAAAILDAVRAGGTLDANDGSEDDVAYLSCLPWLDFTSIDNALPHARDAIPRVSWGRIVPRAGGGHDMAVAIQVHHALVDGWHVGRFFEEMARALAAHRLAPDGTGA
jgi:chloramphenicol O-acetyltransferase type A